MTPEETARLGEAAVEAVCEASGLRAARTLVSVMVSMAILLFQQSAINSLAGISEAVQDVEAEDASR